MPQAGAQRNKEVSLGLERALTIIWGICQKPTNNGHSQLLSYVSARVVDSFSSICLAKLKSLD